MTTKTSFIYAQDFLRLLCALLFLNSKGFKVGVDGSVVVADLGASGKVDSASFNKPMIAFILGERGLMYNVTLEGARIWKFVP